MKSNIIFLSLFFFLILSSCSKIGTFNLSYESEVVIPSTFGQLVPFSVSTPEITTNSESNFESNGTTKDRIKKVNLSGLKLSIKSPSNEDFSFLNSISIYISADGLEEKNIAFKENIPNTVGNSIDCEIIEVDLQDYVKNDKYKIRTECVTDETIAQDIEITIKSDFAIQAKIFK